jgi:hypothetical protein
MELVTDNPFRVLGLSATATSREISKRVSDLETFAELGKAKKYDSDLSFFGGVERSIVAIKTAAQKIEQAESKLFYSFFWFRSGHEADAKALAALATGDHSQALATWNHELSKSGQRRYSSRLNRAVLKLWLATGGSTFDRAKFVEALEDIGFVVDDHLDESVDEVLGAAAVGLNRDALWRRVVDNLLTIAQSIPGKPYGTNAMALVGICWSFPPSTLDYIKNQVTNPVLERVEATVEASKAVRSQAKNASELLANHEFKEAEELLMELQDILGVDDQRFQTVSNDFAQELCNCAIKAYNEFDDLDISSKLIAWSAQIPSFGQVKVRIVENRETLDENVEQDKKERLLAPIAEALEVTPQSIPDAQVKLNSLKVMLTSLKSKLGASDPLYIGASSRCAHYILGYAIDVGNATQNSSSSQTLEHMASVIGNCVRLTHELVSMDLDDKCRTRLATNLEIMKKVQSQIQAAYEKSKPSGWAMIPGWLWIVGIIFLIGILN